MLQAILKNAEQITKTMNKEEFYRLLGYWHAKQNRPWTSAHGKRHIKSKASGYGQILKRSYIKSQVPVEKIFPEY
jgi:hypothetical protein